MKDVIEYQHEDLVNHTCLSRLPAWTESEAEQWILEIKDWGTFLLPSNCEIGILKIKLLMYLQCII